MYAIIENKGKQYKVQEGEVIEIDLLQEKKEIEFSNVLLLNDGSSIKVGTPYIKNCLVTAEVLEETKGPKVIAFKYKRRKNQARKKGHRQKYTKIRINRIKHGS